MAHNVYFNLPEREMGKVDAHFVIKKDGEKLGELTISKGGFEYYPRNRRNPIKISWDQFDRMIKKHFEE